MGKENSLTPIGEVAAMRAAHYRALVDRYRDLARTMPLDEVRVIFEHTIVSCLRAAKDLERIARRGPRGTLSSNAMLSEGVTSSRTKGRSIPPLG